MDPGTVPELRVVTDARCLEHRVPYGFPERPERLERVLAGLAGVEIVDDLPERHPRVEAVARRVHAPEYVERFRRAVSRGDGLLDSADNPLTPTTWEAAWAAAGAALAAVDWALEGDRRHAFAAIRPPGHHAERAVAMGFCYLNNVALAAEHLLERKGFDRVAIVDFDVHHGNGTQHLFEERGDVFYASLHRYPFYPGTGAASERGRGEGAGATLNLPMAAASGDAEYRRVFEEELLPALERFAPQALLVSAGFDTWRDDPLGGMAVTLEGHAEWGRLLAAQAAELCEGRVVSVLEGGYDLEALAELVSAYLEGVGQGLG